MKKILFLINPFSGIGKQKTIEQLIDKKLDKEKFSSEIIYTEHAGHAIDLSKENSNKFDIIAAVGGDGSINEVSHGLIGSDTVMAMIPAGSGNGFARHLKIPLEPAKAFDLINKLNIKSIDTVKINDRFFVNLAGLGFDADMGYKFAAIKKRGFGGYFKAVIGSMSDFKAEKRKIEINGEVIEKEAFILSVSNASQYGFNAVISPHSQVDDGIMEITVIEKFPFIIAPAIAIRLFTRRIHKSKYSTVYKSNKVKIINKGNVVAHIDGEPVIFKDDLNINLLPKSLKIVVP